MRSIVVVTARDGNAEPQSWSVALPFAVVAALGCGAEPGSPHEPEHARVATGTVSAGTIAPLASASPSAAASGGSAARSTPSPALVRLNVQDTNLTKPGAIPDERLMLGGARTLLPGVAQCWASTASTARWIEVEWRVDDVGAPVDVKAHPVFQPPAGSPPVISQGTLECVAVAARAIRFTASPGRKPARVIALYGVNLPELAGQPVAKIPFYPNQDGTCSEAEECPANKRCMEPPPMACPREMGIAPQPTPDDADHTLSLSMGGPPAELGYEALVLSRNGTVCSATLRASYAIPGGERQTATSADIPCSTFTRVAAGMRPILANGPRESPDSKTTYRAASSSHNAPARDAITEYAEWAGDNKLNRAFDALAAETLAQLAPVLETKSRRLGL